MKTPLCCVPYLLLLLAAKTHQKPRNRRLEITTNLYAHYAMTEVVATFETGAEDREVTFDLTMPEDAFVTGFEIVVNNNTCTATIEELEEAQRIYQDNKIEGNSTGITVNKPDGSKQTFQTRVNAQRHATGKFVLTYEASRGRRNGDDSQPYVLEIPVETKAIYESLTVKYDIKENLKINPSSIEIKHDLSILQEDDWGAENVEVKAKNVNKNKEKSNHWLITFYYEPYIAATCDDTCLGLLGNFVVEYDIVRSSGRYLLETFVTQDSVAAIVSPNPTLNSDISQDVIVVMDTSGSMEEDDKLRSIQDVVADKVLERVGENDKITLIGFDDKINNLGTFTGDEGSIKEAIKKITALSAEGWTNINDALLEALDYANRRDRSSSVPVIILYTDGNPAGPVNGGFVVDREIIKRNVRAKNTNDYPIYSMAIGSGEIDTKFLKEISNENNGQFFDLTGKSDHELRQHLDESYIFVQRPIYATNNKLAIQSSCLDESTFNNDIAKQPNGIKFLSPNVDPVDLANVQFRENLPDGEACEVLVTYVTTVKHQEITELAKICFPNGPRGRHKRINPNNACPSRISRRGSEPTTKTSFIDRLRAFKEIKKDIGLSKKPVEQAKKGNFAVGGLTAFVVVATSDSGHCETQETKINQTGTQPPFAPSPLATGLFQCPYTTRCEVTLYSSTNFGGEEAINFCDDNIDLVNNGENWNNKVASLNVTSVSTGSCPGIVLYEKPHYQGESKFFPVGTYPSVMDLKSLFKNAQSMKLKV